MRSIRYMAFALAFTLGGFTQHLAADGGGSGGSRDAWKSPYQELIDNEEYETAISELKMALADKPKDPDLLNLLAYSQRKLERYDDALANYQKALKADPEHRGANEYLGELYLTLGKPEMAEERLKVLDDACFFGCDEYDMLKDAIEAYHAQNQ